jgi:hypothetical protein
MRKDSFHIVKVLIPPRNNVMTSIPPGDRRQIARKRGMLQEQGGEHPDLCNLPREYLSGLMQYRSLTLANLPRVSLRYA